jgi:molecular chaperone DnaK
MVSGCQSLGVFHLSGIKPLPKGQAKIKITVSLDTDGLLCVTAEDASSGKQEKLHINAARHVTYERIEQEISQSGDDILDRIWVQKSHQSQDALNEVRRVLNVYPDEIMENACLPLEQSIRSGDVVQLTKAWDDFSNHALPFLETYMTHMLKTMPPIHAQENQ